MLSNVGDSFITGVDEAGRGCLAGPVVACACILPENCVLPVRDSKKLSVKQREQLYNQLTDPNSGVKYALGIVDSQTIDQINILNATKLAMKQAIEQLINNYPEITLEKALIDGNMKFTDLPIPYESIVKGDDKIPSISGASIIAKVHRDHMMNEYSQEYPDWKFDKHKGYGTQEHMTLISQCGICPIHRLTFRPISHMFAQKLITR